MNGENAHGGGASRTTDPAFGSSTATDVSLREYEDEKIRTLRWSVGAVLVFGAFAWSEIQRRLEILNHENARLLQQQEKTVSQDTYAANEQQRKQEQADLNEWRKEVDKDRTQTITRDEFRRDTRVENRAERSSNLSVALVAIGFAAVVIALLTYIAIHHH